MSNTKLIEIVNQMYGALPAMDWDTYQSHMHADFCVVEADSLPYAGTYRGMDGFQQLVGIVFGMFSDFIPTITDMAVSDNRVMVWVDMTMTGAKSGKTINTPMIEVFSFEGDKVREIRPFYFDTDLINSIVS